MQSFAVSSMSASTPRSTPGLCAVRRTYDQLGLPLYVRCTLVRGCPTRRADLRAASIDEGRRRTTPAARGGCRSGGAFGSGKRPTITDLGFLEEDAGRRGCRGAVRGARRAVRVELTERMF